MTQIIVPDESNLILDGPYLDVPGHENVSAWTGARKVIGGPGAEVWYGRVTIDLISTEDEERAWRAFLFALNGRENWFKAPLPCHQHAGGFPTISGVPSQYSLALGGMAPALIIARSGQFMTVPLPTGRFRTVCLISNLTTNSLGNATATFRPALTEAPSLGATVETKNPFLPVSATTTRLGLSNDQGVSGTAFDVREYR